MARGGTRCFEQRSSRSGYADLLQLFPAEDGLRHELIDGVHVVTPAPAIRHQRIVEERHGMGEYWIVDPSANTVEVLRRAADKSLRRVGVLRAADHHVLTTPLREGFAVDLARFFR